MGRIPVLDKNKHDHESTRHYNKIIIIKMLVVIKYKDWNRNSSIGKKKFNVYSQSLHVKYFVYMFLVNGPDLNKVLTQFNHSMQTKRHS